MKSMFRSSRKPHLLFVGDSQRPASGGEETDQIPEVHKVPLHSLGRAYPAMGNMLGESAFLETLVLVAEHFAESDLQGQKKSNSTRNVRRQM